jgi:hypothetical protein
MTPEQATDTMKTFIDRLKYNQAMFLEFKNQKTLKVCQYLQENINTLIDRINEDFFQSLINNIEGEFL